MLGEQFVHGWTRIGLLMALVALSTGCTTTHTSYLSDHWIAQPQGVFPASFSHPSPTLQIIITYDGPLSSHAALRLVNHLGTVTFWDPAGGYGLHPLHTELAGTQLKPNIIRVKDVVVEPAPDLPTYVQFRWAVGDLTVEVFEWDVSSSDAQRFQAILREGIEAPDRVPEFFTETTPAFCTVAISEFLQRFAGPTLTLSDWYLWPHNLAQALIGQRPSRIRVFRQNQPESTYIAPHRMTRQDSSHPSSLHP